MNMQDRIDVAEEFAPVREGLAFAGGISAKALMAQTFPPIQWIARPVLVEGLTVLAGAPKLGKSWMVLGVAVAVANGGMVLGPNPCEQGDVLYLALEDNPRRLQSRIRAMCLSEIPERLTFNTEWPNLDGGCLKEIRLWLEGCAKPRLVIIDVYAKVRGSNRSNETQYEADYRFVTALQALAGEFGLSIVLVHHTRKMEAEDPFDAVSGTRGITGAADSVLVLKKDAGTQQPILYGRGRDMPEFEKAVQFDAETCTWAITGDAVHLAPTIEGQAIMEVLAREGVPLSPKDIAERLGKERTNIQHQMTKLLKAGKLQKEAGGLYILFTPFTHSLSSVNRVNEVYKGSGAILSPGESEDDPVPGWD